jgi:hypothetical protein
MAGISQQIPNYSKGMSEQPDQLKLPGQVKNIVNGTPDITYGLFKRPGSKRIGIDPLANVQSGGSWFHYYRDETEGSYIGQVDSIGNVRVWSCNTGAEMTVKYGDSDTEKTAVTTYLTPSPSSDTEDIQALTINDTTFLNNRSVVVTTSGLTDTKAISTGVSDNQAYIELLRTENGRQYGLNIATPNAIADDTLTRATRVKIKDDTLAEGEGTGNCPGIGTQVFAVTASSSYTGTSTVSVKDSGNNDLTTGKENLIFRITTLGQLSTLEGQTDKYQCTYNRDITLLHGGEGWAVGDKIVVTLDTAKGGGAAGTDDETKANYTIEVLETETISVKGDVKIARPTPTPFDSDTAVTADTILGGIQAELSGITVSGNPLNTTVIGNGLFIYCASPFNIEVAELDLMRVMQDSVNDVTDLPNQCKNGYIVKIANARMSDEDDYYLKFTGDNGDGTGAWNECPEPNIVKGFDASTMPHVIQRTAVNTFTVKPFTWEERLVGDNNTNPIPTFSGKKINKVLFFRNRLAFLSGENVVLCKPGTLGKPDFWAETALTVSSVDPIDIACSSTFPSDLFDGIEINTGLLAFSTNQQFLLSSDDTVLNPDTAKLRSISTYNYNSNIPPISLGTTVGYIDNSGKYSRFNQMTNITREGEPIVSEESKLVPTLLEKDIDLITNSRENQIVLFGKTGTDTVVGFRYFISGDKRLQGAWFKWKFNNTLKYHFIINDEYFYLDEDNFLQTINLVQSDTDISINKDDVNYQIHLDNYVTGITGGSFNTNANTTTFYADWITKVTPIIDSSVVGIKVSSNDGTINVINDSSVLQFVGSSDSITSLSTGDAVKFIENGHAVGNLTDGATYYIYKESLTQFKLATSYQNVFTGSFIAYTSGGGLDRNCHFITLPYIKINELVIADGTGRYAVGSLDGNYVTVSGDWTTTPNEFNNSISGYALGYLYDYQVDFPTLYVSTSKGEVTRTDVNASLTLHRLNFNFGKVGSYETTLTRLGKDPYTEIYESTDTNLYEASDAPYLEEAIKTIPVYERNKNVDITLKSTSPTPATLHSMSWEGDYSSKYYKRV